EGPMAKIANASVLVVSLSSATTAPTTPRSMSALRSSKSASGSRSDARRGCHAIAYAQPTAKLRLRKSRRMNVGWANCSTLFSIDSHEFPLGSIPPPAPALAISSAGLAPNAAEDKTLTRAMTATTAIARSAHPRWRFEERPIRIMFDVFISLESSLLVGRALATIFRQRAHGYLQHATARFTAPTS